MKVQEIFYILLCGRNMISHKIREGDICEVVQINDEWIKPCDETRLCLILPIIGINKKQASILVKEGIFFKRQYRISFEDLQKEYNLDISAIRDKNRHYQPFVRKGIVIDLSNSRLVTDKQNNIIDMNSIELKT